MEKPFETYLVGETGIKLAVATGSTGVATGSVTLAGTLTGVICDDSIIIAELATKFVD